LEEWGRDENHDMYNNDHSGQETEHQMPTLCHDGILNGESNEEEAWVQTKKYGHTQLPWMG